MTTADLALYAGAAVIAHTLAGPLAAGVALVGVGLAFALLDAFLRE